MTTHTIIDAPISTLTPVEDIDAWIERLRTEFPQDDEGVRLAIRTAKAIRARAVELATEFSRR